MLTIFGTAREVEKNFEDEKISLRADHAKALKAEKLKKYVMKKLYIDRSTTSFKTSTSYSATLLFASLQLLLLSPCPLYSFLLFFFFFLLVSLFLLSLLSFS